MRTTVCIGFADALSAPEVCWSLVDAGFHVVAFARAERSCTLRYSKHVKIFDVPDPAISISSTVAALNRELPLIAAPNALPLVPLDDAAVHICSLLDSSLNLVLVGASQKTAAVALDKAMQLGIAEQSGFNVIPTFRGAETGNVSQQYYPLVVKPRFAIRDYRGALTKGRLYNLTSRADYDNLATTGKIEPDALIQPFIRGVGEGVFGLAIDGKVVGWSAHRRVRMMNPGGSGSSACMAIKTEPSVIESANQFIVNSGWEGMFMVELLRDENGKVWFMEFNGRPWGSMALARRQGFEYPAWAVGHAVGNDISAGVFSAKSVELFCRHLGRELIHLLCVFRGPQRGHSGEWPGIYATLKAMLFANKPTCWYNWRRDDSFVFFGDMWQTIRGCKRSS